MLNWSRLSQIFCLGTLIGCLCVGADAQGAKQSINRTASDNAALAKAVKTYIASKVPANAKPGGISVSDLRTQGGWATAFAEKKGLDPLAVVMRKEKGRWVGVTYGTNMAGTGAEYHIPRRVWEKIGMAPYNLTGTR